MLQCITTPLLESLLLEVLFVLLVVRFGRGYYQHTVVLKNSPRQESFRIKGRMMDVFLKVLYVVWLGSNIFAVVTSTAITKQSSSDYFFHLPILEQLPFYGLVILHLSSAMFFVWPAFRSYIMSKVHLDPQQYVHRIAVWWMFSCLIDFMSVSYFMPITDFRDKIAADYQYVLFIKCKDALLAVLAIGSGVTP